MFLNALEMGLSMGEIRSISPMRLAVFMDEQSQMRSHQEKTAKSDTENLDDDQAASFIRSM